MLPVLGCLSIDTSAEYEVGEWPSSSAFARGAVFAASFMVVLPRSVVLELWRIYEVRVSVRTG